MTLISLVLTDFLIPLSQLVHKELNSQTSAIKYPYSSFFQLFSFQEQNVQSESPWVQQQTQIIFLIDSNNLKNVCIRGQTLIWVTDSE